MLIFSPKYLQEKAVGMQGRGKPLRRTDPGRASVGRSNPVPSSDAEDLGAGVFLAGHPRPELTQPVESKRGRPIRRTDPGRGMGARADLELSFSPHSNLDMETPSHSGAQSSPRQSSADFAPSYSAQSSPQQGSADLASASGSVIVPRSVLRRGETAAQRPIVSDPPSPRKPSIKTLKPVMICDSCKCGKPLNTFALPLDRCAQKAYSLGMYFFSYRSTDSKCDIPKPNESEEFLNHFRLPDRPRNYGEVQCYDRRQKAEKEFSIYEVMVQVRDAAPLSRAERKKILLHDDICCVIFEFFDHGIMADYCHVHESARAESFLPHSDNCSPCEFISCVEDWNSFKGAQQPLEEIRAQESDPYLDGYNIIDEYSRIFFSKNYTQYYGYQNNLPVWLVNELENRSYLEWSDCDPETTHLDLQTRSSVESTTGSGG